MCVSRDVFLPKTSDQYNMESGIRLFAAEMAHNVRNIFCWSYYIFTNDDVMPPSYQAEKLEALEKRSLDLTAHQKPLIVC